jgi:hypothetical protein
VVLRTERGVITFCNNDHFSRSVFKLGVNFSNRPA